MKNNNNLTTKPIPQLIRQIAIPASIGMFFNTMYNVVDTYFGGLISTEALASLSLSFPVFFIIIAMGTGISTGASALIANALGADKEDEAMQYVAQSISFSVIIGFVLTILGWLVAPFLFRTLGAEGQYLDMALSYMNIIIGSTIFFILVYVLNSCLNAQGDTKTFRNFLIAGFFLNIILDPWFVFGGLGLPALGIAGVAWATVIIEFFGVFYIGYKALKSGIICSRCWGMLWPRAKYYIEISRQGFPASLNMMTVALGIFIITYFIAPFGKTAVAAYGIATRIDQIALLPTMGLNIAALTLVGQNNGAGIFDRCREAYIMNLKYGFWIVNIGVAAVLIFARQLLSFFSGDPEVVGIGVSFLRISAITYWAYMILYISVSALQGLKRPMYAIWIGLYRQIGAPALIFWLLATVMGFGLLGIWWGIFIINWSATIVTLLYTRRTMNKILNK